MKTYFVLERLTRIHDPRKAADRGEIRHGGFTLRMIERGDKLFIRGTRGAIEAYRAQFGDGLPAQLE